MAKTGMSDFRKNREDKSKQVRLSPQVEAEGLALSESQEASPMLSGKSKTAGAIKKTERKTMRLPVTGTDIEMTVTEVVPAGCAIHPRNKRVQSLLKPENPKVASLKESFERDSQRDPVLARWIATDEGQVLEILDGSRRRFVGDLIYRENPEFRLKAWVGKISDADADYLAKAGNDDRDDISPWELSQYLRQVERDHPDWSHEVIAANERMSRTSVNNLLAIGDIPLEVVSLLESPDLLKVNSGLQVVKLLRGVEDDRYIKVLQREAPFSRFSDLANRLKELLKPKPKTETPSANRKVEIKRGKKLRASIGVNRRTKGQFKIDLYDLSDSEYKEVLASLEQILA